MKAAVLTLSDSCVAGTRVDESGPHIASRLAEAGWEIVAAEIARDERAEIEAALVRFADELGADVVLTTGGTGFSTRDVTPEATLAARRGSPRRSGPTGCARPRTPACRAARRRCAARR